MKFLSLCSGIEAASVAWYPLQMTCVGIADIEQFANAVTAFHYPDVPNFGDISKFEEWPEEAFAEADIIVGGPPCFTAGHFVLTESGYRPIEALRPGDLVMTHLGRLQPVLRVGSKMATVGELRAVGIPMPVTVTPEHPILSVNYVNQSTKRNNEYVKIEHCGEPEWTEAKDMPGKQWCALTAYMPMESSVQSIKFSEREAMYLAGLYLGDGHIRNREGRGKSLVLSLNGAKLAKMASILGEGRYGISHERTSVRATFYDTQLCEWMLENFGHFAHMKRLPSWVLSHKYRADLLQGYLQTDGYQKGNGCGASTTSVALAFGIADLLNAEGYVSSVALVETPDTCVIEDRTVNQRDWYQVRAFKGDVSRKSRVRHGYLLRTVQSYTECGEQMVFNIEVAEDNSYVVQGMVVHNCQAFSIAGLRNGLNDARGNLTLTYVRIIDHADRIRLRHGKPPIVCVYENVPGLLSDKTGAFGSLIGALAGEDSAIVPPRGKWTNAGMVAGPQRTLGWRVLDAQYFGLAQRRKRVFLVGSAREGFDPFQILSEPEGVQRHTAPCRKTWKDAAGTAGEGAGGGGGTGEGSGAGQHSGRDGGTLSHWDGDQHPHPTLNQSAKGSGGVGASNQEIFSQRGAYLAPAALDVDENGLQHTVGTLCADTHPGAYSGQDAYTGRLIPQSVTADGNSPETVSALTASMGVGSYLSHNKDDKVVICDSQPIFLDPLNQDTSTELAKTIAARNDMDGSGVVTHAMPPVEVQCVSGDVTHTLRGEGFDAMEDGGQKGTPIINVPVAYDVTGSDPTVRTGAKETDVHTALRARPPGASEGSTTTVVAQPIPFDTTQITSPSNYSKPEEGDPCHPLAAGAHPPAIAFSAKDHGADATEDLSPTLRAMGHDGSHANGGGQMAVAIPILEPGMGVNEEIAPTIDTGAAHGVAYAFQPRIARNGRGDMGDIVNTLNAQSGETGKGDAAPCVAVGFYANEGSLGSGNNIEMSPTLKAHPKTSNLAAVAQHMAVRRLTPVECEILMGFPRNYTMIPWRKKPAEDCPDGPRYKALGNSMAVPCMRWIGERIIAHIDNAKASGDAK
jgi:site-specific DNA-cytosine methylase